MAGLQQVEVGGRTTTIRPATPADLDALEAYYHALPADDLRRRFLSTFWPRRSFIERWLGQGERGGLVLLAVETGPDGERIVGDAGFAPLAADVAEFAMTVAPDRRGWLGPYLLDVLVEQARERGVAVLSAEVLASNAGMLTLLWSRGCALRPSQDATILEVLLGTSGTTPTWPADDPHPRVLIEGPVSAWPGSSLAGKGNHAVLACPGPTAGRSHPCPLLDGRSCPLVDGADAVLVALGPTALGCDALLAAHAARDDGRPIGLRRDLRQRAPAPLDRRAFHLDPMASPAEATTTVQAAIAAASAAAGRRGGQAAPRSSR
jgi:ribosomal protein S18 acetylase RimI-like enzyme